MTFYAFRLLSPTVQLYWVLKFGTFLTNRWDEEVGAVNLYHLPDGGRGFFVEIGFERDGPALLVRRCFVSTVPLEDYTHGVQLPQGWA